MKKLSVLLLIISSQLSLAQSSRNYSNEFLNIGVDAAAFGMSKSVTATSKDVNSIYWNPAGLANVEINQGALMHTEYFAGIANYDYVSAAIAPKEGNKTVIAFSLIRFGVDNILNTATLIDSQGNIDFSKIRLFSAADYALNFALATKIKRVKNLDIGINAKVIRRTIGDFASSWGFGFDAGIQYAIEDWELGLMARDLTTSFNIWEINSEKLNSIKEAIPGQNSATPETVEITIPKLHFGIARNFQLKNKNFHLLSALDLHIRFIETNDLISTSFASLTPSIGFQLDYKKIVFLRSGIGNLQKVNTFTKKSLTLEPNIGLGFKYHGVQIDYALSNIASSGNALYSNTFSIKVDFDFYKSKKTP